MVALLLDMVVLLCTFAIFGVLLIRTRVSVRTMNGTRVLECVLENANVLEYATESVTRLSDTRP